MQINLNKEIKNLRGESINATVLPREKVKEMDGQKVKLDEFPKETVRDVILNSLASYQNSDNSIKSIFYVQKIGGIIVDSGETIELEQKHIDFIKKALIDAVARTEIGNQGEKIDRGIYMSWVIAQVLTELGITEE